MKKVFLLLIIALSISSISKATHVVGGDFQINMVSQNATGADYHIKLRYYRDDISGAVNMPTTMSVTIYDAVTHQQVASQNLTRTTNIIVPLGDPCYTPDPNTTRIEEGVFESPSNLTLPNNSNGYYIQTQMNARNALAINVTGTSGNGTMVWMAMIPDPAIGQNSSPDFGDYPLDAYFCTSGPKSILYPITDADGDSLVYSLVAPLDANNTSNGGQPGVGAYPFYPSLVFQAGYSLANYVGGTTPMTIDQITGEIIAAPTTQGFYTFAILVEEFRNGVKIGETRRDVQYASFNCTSASAPNIVNTIPNNSATPDTLYIPYNKEYCKDIIFGDQVGDTLFINFQSDIFDSGAVVTTPIADAQGNLHYDYNWNATSNSWDNSVVIDSNEFMTINNVILEWNTDTIAKRFCWTPKCPTVDSTYEFNANGFSIGCAGNDTLGVTFYITVVNPVINFQTPTFTPIIPYGEEYCQDISYENLDLPDTLNLVVISDHIFNFGATYPTLSNTYLYNNTVLTNVPNNEANPKSVGTQFCWTPICENIDSTFTIEVALYSSECPLTVNDTISFDLTVTPPSINLSPETDLIIPFGEEFCKDFSYEDQTFVDNLNMDISSDIFNFGADYPSLSNSYLYNGVVQTNAPNGATNMYSVGSQVCWTPICENIGNTYNVEVALSSFECPQTLNDTVSFNITVTPPFDSLDVVPNVFTPNGDGFNDTYRIGGISNPCNDTITVEIFNRWGIQVFKSDEPTFEWDGKNNSGAEVPSGTYFMIINGVFGSEPIEIEKRTINVLR